MTELLADIVAQLIDPIKLIAAILIYRSNPSWLIVLVAAVLIGVAVNLFAEMISNIGGVFQILVVPGIIASVLLLSTAKGLAIKLKTPSEAVDDDEN